MILLHVKNLCLDAVDGRPIVTDFAIDVAPGEIVGIVGESGSGKTMTALSLLGLLPGGVHASSGEATLDGERYLSGGQVQARPHATMIFQDPTAALNPTMRIGAQLTRLLRTLEDPRRRSRRERQDEAEGLLVSVGIDDAPSVMRRYPHQLSGGMNQRVMIAMALAAEPSLLVADEPTTGLDVTVQAQILQIIRETVATRGLGVLFVSHDMGVIAQMCQRVAVMCGGEVREFAGVDEVFHAPQDDYTRELLAAATDEPLEVDDGTRA